MGGIWCVEELSGGGREEEAVMVPCALGSPVSWVARKNCRRWKGAEPGGIWCVEELSGGGREEPVMVPCVLGSPVRWVARKNCRRWKGAEPGGIGGIWCVEELSGGGREDKSEMAPCALGQRGSGK